MDMSIGEKIKQVRVERGMTQDDLAAATGITKTAISRYELGQRQPSVEQLNVIADALNIWVFDLINLSPDKQIELKQSADTLSRIMEKLAQRNELPLEIVEMLTDLKKSIENELTDTLSIANMTDQVQNKLRQTEMLEQRRKQLGEAQKERTEREKALFRAFWSLTDVGQKKALELMEDFAKIPDYQQNRKRPAEKME